MFTGLIETTGKVVSTRRTSRGGRFTIASSLEGLEIGESVSVNGACQTVAELDGGAFSCDVLPETLRVTNLGRLRAGSAVNLERALAADARLGGHIVNGHVDGVGRVTRVIRDPLGIEIDAGRELGRYMVSKGSVAVDGISLTIGPDLSQGRFRVFIIPHTFETTTLGKVRPGSRVNIEVDILAKYVEKFRTSREV
ncbi:MAG: riboflavin synthase [Candidatus Krumholzibacteria bacterium]|nr:riboflavin synthase [Candidatus Krumholzibacteria bacterium]